MVVPCHTLFRNFILISILICTFNRGSLISDTLQSLIENQSHNADEILIVNGGGEKDCSDTLSFWETKCSYLKEIKTQNINLANSRNIGLQQCTGDLILMTDDDARVFPDWIEKMKDAHLKYPEAGVIGGEVVDASGDSFLSRVADVITFPHYTDITEVNSVPGVNCSYKKKVIETIGLQDITMFRGEDVDYNWRAKEAGFKVLYIPEIKVYHAHRPSWKGLFNQHHMYGRAYYRVRKKWTTMYCAYPRHLKTPKMWLKGIYYLLTPFHYAFQKARQLPNLAEKIAAFPIIWALSYYTMYGNLKQWMKDIK